MKFDDLKPFLEGILSFLIICCVIVCIAPLVIHMLLYRTWRWYRSFFAPEAAKQIILKKLQIREEELFQGDWFNLLYEREYQRIMSEHAFF